MSTPHWVQDPDDPTRWSIDLGTLNPGESRTVPLPFAELGAMQITPDRLVRHIPPPRPQTRRQRLGSWLLRRVHYPELPVRPLTWSDPSGDELWAQMMEWRHDRASKRHAQRRWWTIFQFTLTICWLLLYGAFLVMWSPFGWW